MSGRSTRLSGYPELLPGERLVEQHVLDVLRGTFELHGFGSVETRAVEPLEVLLRKGEIDKEVYVVRRLHADGDGDAPGDADLALHYDLTVPFARYVLENAGHLHFPFRRYQIQKCWRGERPQEGRYREFLQADIDVVDRDRLAPHHDVEIMQVMADAFAALPLPPVRMQVNNRKLIEGYYRGVGVTDVAAVMREVDKLDKVGAPRVHAALTAHGLTGGEAEACLALAEVTGDDADVVERVRTLGVTHPLLDDGLAELAAVMQRADALHSDRFAVVADLRIARGLDYYTGTVYETRMVGYESLGSVCSGGRYDALADDGRSRYPGVGISVGVTRMLVPLLARGALTANRSTPSAVLVAVTSEESRSASDVVAAALRARGIACEVAPAAAKFGKQIRHAERRGIPYVWFPGDGGDDGGKDEVKDIRSGAQAPASRTTWEPPAADARPQVSRVRPDAVP